jgi:hypothetical protein
VTDLYQMSIWKLTENFAGYVHSSVLRQVIQPYCSSPWNVGLSNYIKSVLCGLDTRVSVLIMVLVCLFILRSLLSLILGKEGAGSFIGHLAYDIFALPFRALVGLLRLCLSRRVRRS